MSGVTRRKWVRRAVARDFSLDGGTGATDATPLLVGDLLRREGHEVTTPTAVPDARTPGAVQARVADEPASAEVPGIAVARRRTADACRTALGAGGLVVAGSVLGAALLAAAGVGGPIFSGQSREDGQGQVFGGGASADAAGRAHGAVTGQEVVSAAGLLRQAFESVAYPAPTAPAVSFVGRRSVAGPVAALAATGGDALVAPVLAAPTRTVGDAVGTVTTPVTRAAGDVVGTVASPVHARRGHRRDRGRPREPARSSTRPPR